MNSNIDETVIFRDPPQNYDIDRNIIRAICAADLQTAQNSHAREMDCLQCAHKKEKTEQQDEILRLSIENKQLKKKLQNITELYERLLENIANGAEQKEQEQKKQEQEQTQKEIRRLTLENGRLKQKLDQVSANQVFEHNYLGPNWYVSKIVAAYNELRAELRLLLDKNIRITDEMRDLWLFEMNVPPTAADLRQLEEHVRKPISCITDSYATVTEPYKSDAYSNYNQRIANIYRQLIPVPRSFGRFTFGRFTS